MPEVGFTLPRGTAPGYSTSVTQQVESVSGPGHHLHFKASLVTSPSPRSGLDHTEGAVPEALEPDHPPHHLILVTTLPGRQLLIAPWVLNHLSLHLPGHW